jgi:hypothetical protein
VEVFTPCSPVQTARMYLQPIGRQTVNNSANNFALALR